MKNIFKRTISKKIYNGLIDGTIEDIEFEMTPYWCKRIKGLSGVCPYSLPFNGENRFCQKYGKPCDSGKNLRYFNAELKQAKSDNILICEISTMQLSFKDDKLMIKINLSNITKK